MEVCAADASANAPNRAKTSSEYARNLLSYKETSVDREIHAAADREALQFHLPWVGDGGGRLLQNRPALEFSGSLYSRIVTLALEWRG